LHLIAEGQTSTLFLFDNASTPSLTIVTVTPELKLLFMIQGKRKLLL